MDLERIPPGDWNFDRDARGEPLTVGGRRARLSIEPGCHDIDGDVSMTAVVETPSVPEDWFQFDVCVRQPGVDRVEVQARRLLASVRFAAEE